MGHSQLGLDGNLDNDSRHNGHVDLDGGPLPGASDFMDPRLPDTGAAAEPLEAGGVSFTAIADERVAKDQWAIGVTWDVPGNRRRQFRAHVGHALMPHLTVLHDAGLIAALLPFHHRPIQGPGGSGWTDYWVILLAPSADPDEIWDAIARSGQDGAEGLQGKLPRAEVLRLQPNIDLFFPRQGDRWYKARWHWIEYVVSRPETRDEYYRDQYLFSGPVIRDFWEAGLVQSAIGFERQRFLVDDGMLPAWDVIHITGFSPVRLVQIAWHLWRSMPIYNDFAKKVGHGSAIGVLRSWGAQRAKYQRLAAQDRRYTLQPAHDTSLVPEPMPGVLTNLVSRSLLRLNSGPTQSGLSRPDQYRSMIQGGRLDRGHR